MANYKKVLLGTSLFFIGFFVTLVLEQIITPIMDAVTSIFTSSDLTGISWFITILLYLLLVIIMPLFFIITGLLEPSQANNKTTNILVGAFIFIFGILLTIKGWYLTTVFASLVTGTLLTVIFWVGLLGVWILTIFISPIMLIIEGTNIQHE